MTPKKAYHPMPEFEGMGRTPKAIMVIVIVVLSIAAIGAMVKGMDSAHGGVVATVR